MAFAVSQQHNQRETLAENLVSQTRTRCCGSFLWSYRSPAVPSATGCHSLCRVSRGHCQNLGNFLL